MQILDGQPVLSASDLVGHLACGHLTALEREAAETGKPRPNRLDPALDVLAKRGREREEKFLDEARRAGRRIVEAAAAANVGDYSTLMPISSTGTVPLEKLSMVACAA